MSKIDEHRAALRLLDDWLPYLSALGYGWSVVIAADPMNGLAVFGQLEELQDKDIAWIVRENRKKARFTRAVAARRVPGG